MRSVGPKSTSIIDLLAVGYARREEDARTGEDTARKILAKYGSIARIADQSADDVKAMTGLEGFEILRSQALVELGRRISAAGKGPVTEIDGPEDVFSLLDHLRHEKQEHFVAVLLDSKNGVQRVAPIHVGTLTMSLVGPREVFREAIRDGASAIIAAHNHPSGDPTPSPEDIEVTKKLVEIGQMLDIPVLDHVIVGYRTFVSMKEKKLI